MNNKNNLLRENITGVRVIRAFNKERHETGRMNATFNQYATSSIQANYLFAGLDCLANVAINFLIVAVVYLGGNAVGAGKMLIGDITSVTEYAIWILLYVMMAQMTILMFPRALTCIRRVSDVLNLKPEITDGAESVRIVERTDIVSFENVSFRFADADEETLSHLSFTCRKGETTAVIGGTGSGKSTMMNILGCLDVPTSGTYHLGGVDVSTMDDDDQAEIRNKMLGFIFQQYNLLPKLNLMENVEVPLVYAGVSRAERHKRAKEVLEKVGLGDKLKNKPNQLSGGQQQRVSIARALVRNPPLILADEPTGALDSHTGREVLGMLQELHNEGHTVVLITHDNSIAVQAERIIRLEDGRVVYDGDSHAPEAVVQPTLLPEQESQTEEAQA